MTGKKRHQRGFSLLEVLISIAILAGIAMVLAPAISAAARASSRIYDAGAEREALRTGGEVFRALIANAIAFEKDQKAGAFTGGMRVMSFASIDPLTGDPVAFEIVADGALLLKTSAKPGASGSSGPAMTYTLISDLNHARFDYFGAHGASKTKSWRTYWAQDQAPDLVRLTARRTTERAPQTLIIEAAPQGRAPLHCKFDPVSRVCRGS